MAKPIPVSNPSSTRVVEVLYRVVTLPVALICFAGSVLTDWAYSRTATIGFSNTSAWLILFGLIAAGLAIAAFLLSFTGGWLDRGRQWVVVVFLAAGFAVEIVNFMIHNRDGWTTVVPTGFALSIVGALLFLVAAWIGRTPAGAGRP